LLLAQLLNGGLTYDQPREVETDRYRGGWHHRRTAVVLASGQQNDLGTTRERRRQMANKLCKDCKWVKRDALFGIFGGYRFAQCTAPKAQKGEGQVLVDGKTEDTINCSVHRKGQGFANYCGAEGRFWEPKQI
jgi:hypothetical protein